VTTFISTVLADHHQISHFTCGEPQLDQWFTERARRDAAKGIARIHVWALTNNPSEVVGFYSVSASQVMREDGLTARLHGGYSVVPAFLLGRLAVATKWQSNGIGAQLLSDALQLLVGVADTAGARLIFVDPINTRASDWYRRFGFTPGGRSSLGPDTFAPQERPERLYLTVADARAALHTARSRQKTH